MKKLFAGLLVLLALVLASPTAMAGRVFCNNCQGWKNMEFVRYQYKADTYHQSVFQCPDCKLEYCTSSVAHTETIAATCQSPAYCDECKSYYGSKAGHNWSAWSISDENQHVRTCQTPGCDAVEYAGHTGGGATCIKEGTCTDCSASYHTDHNWGAWTKADENQHVSTCQNSGCNQTQSGEHTGGNATCSTEGTCTVCYGSYKDSNNHTGPYTNAYAPSASSATQHTVTETCTGCRKISRFYGEDHQLEPHDAQAPTCTEIGWDAYETCSRCDYTTYVEKKALGHDAVKHDAQAATCTEIGWDAYETCSRCDYSTYAEKPALGHDAVKHDAQAPTCTAIGWDAYETCSRCDYSTYIGKSPLGHNYAAKATKPTCTEKGYTTYTCTHCQDSYRDGSTSPLGHWYGEWSPNADGTNSASCLRDKYKHTVDCAGFGFALTAEDVRTEFVLCPVCGEVSQIRLIDENGEVLETLGAVRLLLAKNTAAEALTKWLPRGELVVRMGALPRGELLMSVAFEWGGEPTQPTGQVKLTLPAQLVDGYSLYLLFEDGTETELTLEGDEEEETVSFTLDFTNSETPVQVIRLIPEV